MATVSRVHNGRILVRIGRGYSRRELQAAGLSLASADRLGIHVDQRRRTEYDFNISRLKEISPAPKAPKPLSLPEEAR
jgi:ribosomal protein L13E